MPGTLCLFPRCKNYDGGMHAEWRPCSQLLPPSPGANIHCWNKCNVYSIGQKSRYTREISWRSLEVFSNGLPAVSYLINKQICHKYIETRGKYVSVLVTLTCTESFHSDRTFSISFYSTVMSGPATADNLYKIQNNSIKTTTKYWARHKSQINVDKNTHKNFAHSKTPK